MSVLVIDKPIGPTSFEVVRRVQRVMARLCGLARPRDLRVGHGGTLDPMASGVLPICLGEATKLAPFLLEADKEYEAAVRFGVTTDTLDAEGAVVAERPLGPLDEAAVDAALAGFRGPISQVPPMYSALKHHGRPLYAYARAGEEIARAARSVTVFELALISWVPPDTARLRVRCSKGTYVRVLAADIGDALGVGAHLSALRRTASGPFHLAQAVSLDALEATAADGAWPRLVALSEVLAHLPSVSVVGPLESAIWQGKQVACGELGLPADASGRVRICREDGSLLAVGEAGAGMVRSLRGFNRDPLTAANALEMLKQNTKLSPTVGLTSTRFL